MTTNRISNDKAITILNKKGVIERLDVTPDKIRNGQTYQVNDRMLLILMPHTKTDVEVHIAQPREHWPYIHIDIIEALIFITGIGYNSVYTNVNQNLKTTLNLLKKHDFKAVAIENEEVILKWELEQQ